MYNYKHIPDGNFYKNTEKYLMTYQTNKFIIQLI